MSRYKNLHDFITRGRRGERYIYHSGDLAIDRTANKELDKLAQECMKHYQNGLLELHQERRDSALGGYFDYVATKQNARKRPFVGCYAEKEYM